jgi:hypothetical protein
MLKFGTSVGADYAITGGFFIVAQLTILTILYPEFPLWK